MGILVNMADAQLPNGESNGAAPDGVASNGTNNFALTAYSSQPTPPSEHAKPKAMVPKDFLLPDGTPDVSMASNGREFHVVSSRDVWPCPAWPNCFSTFPSDTMRRSPGSDRGRG